MKSKEGTFKKIVFHARKKHWNWIWCFSRDQMQEIQTRMSEFAQNAKDG